MEMDDSYLTLLTPDGEFCRAHKQDIPYSVGEEIYFFPIMVQQRNKPKGTFIDIFKLKSVWMSTAVLFVFLGSVVPVYQSNRAYAYVSIDVNPSIELGINKDMKVVELTGYNKEGKNIVSQISDWKKRDVSEVTKQILTELKSEGFVKDEPIIISTVRTEKFAEKAEQKLEQNIKEIKQTVSNQQLEVNMVTTTEAELEKAHELGVTAGKYQEVKMEITEKKQNKAKNQNKNKYTDKSNDEQTNNKNTDKSKDEQSYNEYTDRSKEEQTNNRNNGNANANEKAKNQTIPKESNTDKIPPGQLKKQVW
ncbi:MAG: YkrI [Neobacillus sp.]|nr:YkrI [Neobacillus sp.]